MPRTTTKTIPRDGRAPELNTLASQAGGKAGKVGISSEAARVAAGRDSAAAGRTANVVAPGQPDAPETATPQPSTDAVAPKETATTRPTGASASTLAPGWLRRWADRVLIEGLTGMAHGLFATLIVGTILTQVGGFIPGAVGATIVVLGRMAAWATGAGIGLGTANRLKASTFTLISAAVAGQIGAHAAGLLSGSALQVTEKGTVLLLRGPGEPLGAFLAAYVAIEVGRFVSGRTPVDILVTPASAILTGGTTGLLLGPTISKAMTALGEVINWGTERQPFLMGIIVAVVMGMVLTLPLSSAALGVILGLSGTAAGAATIGCTAQMVGFAVASFRENRWSGLVAQGLGTSMLQVPNIVRHPLIWVPPTLASALLGPVSTLVAHMESNAIGSGMGSAGLVGQIMTWQTMSPTTSAGSLWATILGFQILAPAVLTLAISEHMRRRGWIKPGDMALAMA